MNIDEQRKLAAMIRAKTEVQEVIDILDGLSTEITLVDATPLVHAVNGRRLEIVEYLLDRGANINTKRNNNYSPLMSAVSSKDVGLVKLLMKYNPDLAAKDKHGNDALYLAVNTGDLDIIRELVEAGSDPFGTEQPERYSAYTSAKDMGAIEIIQYFESLR